MEYASPVWYPYTATNIAVLEAAMLNAKLVTMYRVAHNLVGIPAEKFLTPMTRGTKQKYPLSYCRTNVYRLSFFPSAVRLWNKLPVQLTEVDSVKLKPSRLDSHQNCKPMQLNCFLSDLNCFYQVTV
jgi:hypothetical protein